MCGILIALSRKPLDRAHFDAARDTMIHRGPDAQQSVFLEADTVGLGHTRLSIIDLSNRANQPMQDGNLWVTYNGEIYNFPQTNPMRSSRPQIQIQRDRFPADRLENQPP